MQRVGETSIAVNMHEKKRFAGGPDVSHDEKQTVANRVQRVSIWLRLQYLMAVLSTCNRLTYILPGSTPTRARRLISQTTGARKSGDQPSTFGLFFLLPPF